MTVPAPREGGRRVLHLATGTLGVVAVLVSPHMTTILLVSGVAVAALLELARLASRPGAAALHGLFGSYFRAGEVDRPSGASLLAAGYLLTWLVFPASAAARAITVTAVCDPAAALVGRRYGRPSAPGRKTAAGTLAAFAAALVVLILWRTAPLAAVAAAAAAALVERVPLAGTDNVAVPLATAAVLVLV